MRILIFLWMLLSIGLGTASCSSHSEDPEIAYLRPKSGWNWLFRRFPNESLVVHHSDLKRELARLRFEQSFEQKVLLTMELKEAILNEYIDDQIILSRSKFLHVKTSTLSFEREWREMVADMYVNLPGGEKAHHLTFEEYNQAEKRIKEELAKVYLTKEDIRAELWAESLRAAWLLKERTLLKKDTNISEQDLLMHLKAGYDVHLRLDLLKSIDF